MSTPLTFTLQGPPDIEVDVSALCPHRLAGKSAAEIARITLPCGREQIAVGDLFQMRGDETGRIVFEGHTGKLNRVGASLDGGVITVMGDAGHEVAIGMTGGMIEVHGDTGHAAGCEMAGGSLRIHGNTGDFAASARPGNRQGMRGGMIWVEGNAGDRLGERMRRGSVFITGDAGAYAGARMLAGTLFIKGKLGPMPALALKRGTLVLWRKPETLPLYFNDAGVHELDFLKLMRREIERLTELAAFWSVPYRVRRWCGDLGTGAHGEILHPAD